MIVLAGADDAGAEPRLLLPHWLAGSPSPLPTPTATSGIKRTDLIWDYTGKGGEPTKGAGSGTHFGPLRLRGEEELDDDPETYFAKKIILT